jgi:hypothetical protein
LHLFYLVYLCMCNMNQIFLEGFDVLIGSLQDLIHFLE